MLIRDDKEYRNIQQQVAENANDIEALQNKHIYEHLLYVTGTLKNAGVTDENYTFAIRCRILNNSDTQIKPETLANALYKSSIPACGVAHDATNEFQYIVFSIQTSILDKTVLEVSLVTADYTPAGQISSVVGEITRVVDKVNVL